MVQYRGKDVNWHCSRNVWTMINSALVILYLNIWDSMFCNILQIITWCLIFNSTSLQCASVWTLWVQSTFWARQILSLFVGCIRFLRQSIETTRNMCFILPQACHNDVDCALLPYVNEIYLGVLCIILCLLWLDHRYCSMSISYPQIVQGYFTDPVTILWLP